MYVFMLVCRREDARWREQQAALDYVFEIDLAWSNCALILTKYMLIQ